MARQELATDREEEWFRLNRLDKVIVGLRMVGPFFRDLFVSGFTGEDDFKISERSYRKYGKLLLNPTGRVKLGSSASDGPTTEEF